MNRILVDKFKKFMADVCTQFECGEMYQPLEQGFQCLCESFYDFDERPDYDPPGPWDEADRSSITIHYIEGNPDGALFDLGENDGDAYIDFNVEAWFKLAGVSELVPDELPAALEGDDGIEDAATQYTKSWYSPSQYFEDPGDGGSMYKVEIDIGAEGLAEALKASLDACDCPDDLEAKLLAVAPQLATELNKIDGYVNDDNW